jgi:hypothetical protein
MTHDPVAHLFVIVCQKNAWPLHGLSPLKMISKMQMTNDEQRN